MESPAGSIMPNMKTQSTREKPTQSRGIFQMNLYMESPAGSIMPNMKTQRTREKPTQRRGIFKKMMLEIMESPAGSMPSMIMNDEKRESYSDTLTALWMYLTTLIMAMDMALLLPPLRKDINMTIGPRPVHDRPDEMSVQKRCPIETPPCPHMGPTFGRQIEKEVVNTQQAQKYDVEYAGYPY